MFLFRSSGKSFFLYLFQVYLYFKTEIYKKARKCFLGLIVNSQNVDICLSVDFPLIPRYLYQIQYHTRSDSDKRRSVPQGTCTK